MNGELVERLFEVLTGWKFVDCMRKVGWGPYPTTKNYKIRHIYTELQSKYYHFHVVGLANPTYFLLSYLTVK